MEQRVPARPKNDVQVGSENWNDVLFTRQRIRWLKDPQLGPRIEGEGDRRIGGDASRQEHGRRSPLYTYNAHKVQKPSGTDKLGAE